VGQQWCRVQQSTGLPSSELSSLAALTQIDQNIDALGLTENDKTKVVETVGEVRASIKGGSLASKGFALLSTLKEVFEHTAGHLLAAGILHEITKILG